MFEAADFRRWAAQVARQAGEEPDAQEALRLMRIAEYWVKLAELEDRQRESTVCETTNNTSAPKPKSLARNSKTCMRAVGSARGMI
jgi:hypothetical protein